MLGFIGLTGFCTGFTCCVYGVFLCSLGFAGAFQAANLGCNVTEASNLWVRLALFVRVKGSGFIAFSL